MIEGTGDDFTFNSALFEPKSGGPTSVDSVFPNTATKFRSYDSAPELHHWNVDPSVYTTSMKQFFKIVEMRVSLLLSPYFLQNLDEGIGNALTDYMRPFNEKVCGKLLFCKSHKLETKKAQVVPELKGKLAVSVVGEFFCFIPSIGSEIYCDITSIDKDQGVATILKLATVRFCPKAVLEPFMKWGFGSWTFETEFDGIVKLEKRDVICVKVLKVGTEDFDGFLMDVEIEAKDEIVVLKQDGQRYLLKERAGSGEKEGKKKKRKKTTTNE